MLFTLIKLWYSFCNNLRVFFKHVDRQGSEGRRSRSQGVKGGENAGFSHRMRNGL